jgi:4-alpha-glucanotransferase
MHPTSLPGEYGIGDLGSEAYRFIDFLSEAGQSYWQVLPLGPTGYGDSPYQCFSAFAGNTLMISPEKLVENGLLTEEDVARRPAFTKEQVDFGGIYEWKNEVLPKAFRSFQQTAGGEVREKFNAFCRANGAWLDDYALYRSIKSMQGQRPWYEWPDPLKLCDAGALSVAADNLSHHIQAQKFYQFLFFSQWSALKGYANGLGVRIIGDIPIFVALDSADVWRHQEQFKLNGDGSARVVAGVPPDYFSKTGQLWGNPIYDWDKMRDRDFDWWVSRVGSTLDTVDIVRIDHFRGFAAAWEVPGGDETAENGIWVDVPGKELFQALQNALGHLPMIAEDLGVITPDVVDLRDGLGLPGMRILQYAFGGDAKNHDLPHNYIQNCVAYTGTHDNETAVGWFRSQAAAGSTRDAGASRVVDHCRRYLASQGTEIHWDLIRAIWASVADTAIVPMPDILGLGNEARMNMPSSGSGNWHWRMRADAITPEATVRLKELTVLFGRAI